MNVLKIYNDTYWTLLNLNDDIYIKKGKRIVERKKLSSDEEKERVSLCRTKRRIKEICLCNDFTSFGTVTINSQYADRYNLEEVQLKMRKICKKIKRKNKDFKYIFVTEKHEDGAFHFHGLFKDLEVYNNDFGYYSNTDFDTLGFNSFSPIKDYNKACNYITKYITKDVVRAFSGYVYFCSRGMNKPDEHFLFPEDLNNIFGKCWSNEYCQKVDFDLSKLSYQQKINLENYFLKNNDNFLEGKENITNWLQLFTKFFNYDNIQIKK